jgi:hypothetical protein
MDFCYGSDLSDNQRERRESGEESQCDSKSAEEFSYAYKDADWAHVLNGGSKAMSAEKAEELLTAVRDHDDADCDSEDEKRYVEGSILTTDSGGIRSVHRDPPRLILELKAQGTVGKYTWEGRVRQ